MVIRNRARKPVEVGSWSTSIISRVFWFFCYISGSCLGFLPSTGKKNNYFTSSDPHHDMLGGGCQVRVVIKNMMGRMENLRTLISGFLGLVILVRWALVTMFLSWTTQTGCRIHRTYVSLIGSGEGRHTTHLLTFFLTYLLTFFLTNLLIYLLTFFLTYLLTFFLTSFWHIFWHSFWQIFWHSFWHIFWHPFWHIFRHAFWHIFWHSFWHIKTKT